MAFQHGNWCSTFGPLNAQRVAKVLVIQLKEQEHGAFESLYAQSTARYLHLLGPKVRDCPAQRATGLPRVYKWGLRPCPGRILDLSRDGATTRTRAEAVASLLPWLLAPLGQRGVCGFVFWMKFVNGGPQVHMLGCLWQHVVFVHVGAVWL